MSSYREVDYTDERGNLIKGEILYYTTSQVADILSIPDSKVRYYTMALDEILHIRYSNKHRIFTNEDIKRMKFILKLKDSGMTIRQIREYCEDIDFDEETDLDSIKIKDNKPMTFKNLSNSVLNVQQDHNELMLEQQRNQLNAFKEEMFEAMKDLLNKNNELIQEQENLNIEKMTDKVIDEFKNINSIGIDDKLHVIQKSLEERREYEEKRKNRGVFTRIKSFLFGEVV